MARIETLRPSGTVTGNTSNIWKEEGGATFATTHIGKLADDSSTTRASRLSGGGSADLDFEMGTYTKASNERFRRVRLRVKEGHTVGPGQHWFRIGAGNVIAASKLTTPTGYVGNWSTQFTGPWVNVGSAGEWSQADIDALRVKLRAPDTSFTVSEVYVDVEVMAKPVATILNPAEFSGRTSLTPLMSWALNDPSDTQTYFQIKVFTKAVAEAGGFDPDDLTHVWMTGVQSSTTSYRVPAGELSYGSDYYVFVKPYTSMGGVPGASDYEGDWSDGVAFTTYSLNTINATHPADPVTDVDSPTVQWSWTDANGDTLGDWTLRLFTAAQYGAAGFNAFTSTATYEATGKETTSHELPALVNGTTYRAYVWGTGKVTKVGVTAADYQQFEMDLVQPPAPDLTATPDPSTASVLLELLSQSNLLTPAQSSGEAAGVVWLAHSNATATQDTFFGEYRQKLTPLASGTSQIKSPPVAITEGFEYSATADIRKIAGTNRNAAMGFRWLNSSLGAVGGAQGAFVMTNTGTPVNPFCTATAPAGAAFAELIFTVDAATTSDIFTLDQAMLKAGPAPVAHSFGAAPLTHYVERSDDGGATWQLVRGYPTALGASGLSDYEAPFNRSLQYRAFSTTTVSGSPITSEPSSVESVTLDVGVVWLKDPLDPSINATIIVEDNWLPSTIANPRQVQKGLGATKPKVIRGEGRYESFQLSFLVLGEDMKSKLEALLDHQGVICVQSGKRTRYVEVSGDYTSSEWLWDDLRNESQPAWRFVVPFVEVDTP